MSGSNAFGKTICSICYEDLKPLIEDLQSISICGHVFHELCLQQWLEYCSKAKKSSCPVCKQRCSQENVGRLYFQSIGDPNESILSQKQSDCGEDDEEESPAVLRREVRKLQGKISGLSTAFERQQQDLKGLNEEFCLCKENFKKEVALKNDALQQKASAQQVLRLKSEELNQMSSECSRLKERNMALAKELAALKLVSDLNLEEEEMLKLASFGNCNNNKDTIDVLKKSLALRNKSYKELMAQCNLLGRGESRSLKKLEKAKEKMKKLKTRVHELELALEEKDNEVLRVLKASKISSDGVDMNGVKWNHNTPCINKFLSEDQMGGSVEPTTNSNQRGASSNHRCQFTKIGNSVFHKDLGENACKKDINVIDIDLEGDLNHLIDHNVLPVHDMLSPFLKPQTNVSCSGDKALEKSSMSRPRVDSDAYKKAAMQEPSAHVGLLGSSTGTKNDMDNSSVHAMVDLTNISHPSFSMGTLLDEITEDQPLLHIKKETAFPVTTTWPGDQCFVGGLLGPDGTNRYLGKWCKRTQTKPSASSTLMMQGSSTTGSLIAVGADGRGGRIKVLRSQNELESKGTSFMPKKCKLGTKQSGQQSQGCLQIEHFFGKADRS